MESAQRSAGQEELRAVEDQQKEAASAAAVASRRLREFDRPGAALAGRFDALSDPVEGLAQLSARHPILLLPLRLETRFKSSAAGVPQLWVRVYPDECLADGFDETLTQVEYDAGVAFWGAVWAACHDEGRERAAWRDLVATCGSGRAGWVVRRLVPQNPEDQPDAAEGTVRLVLVASDPQSTAVTDYWASVWDAGRDAAALAQARSLLEAAVGATAAVAVVAHPPVNLSEPEPQGGAAAEVSVLLLPAAAALALRTSSWSSAPRVDLLPDRFALLAYDDAGAPPVRVELGRPIAGPLIVGPDPNAPADEQLIPTGADPDHPDTLRIPKDLEWMFDFEKAIEAGMALRFDLTPAQEAAGFARLLVLGVRLSETAQQGAESLERLLTHHLYSRKGLEVLRQGTATNDSGGGGSGYSWREDSDASFGPLFKQREQYTRTSAPRDAADGQNLADGLGLSDDLVARVPGAGLTDRAEARAMQVALWPATIGYTMDALMEPVFPDTTVAATRRFFSDHVSGRGPLPALRIGAQPYGILPTTAFSRLDWFGGRQRDADAAFLDGLVHLIRAIEGDYRGLLGRVSRIGADTEDSHQSLLDVIGLHPTSVEYHSLSADSIAHKAHELSFIDGRAVSILLAMFPREEPVALLRRLGYSGSEIPDLLSRIFHASHKPLDGALIDEVPLSETDRIRPTAGGRNYIEWLADAAADSVAAVQAQNGFDGGKAPTALLYLLLRNAIELGFHEEAVRLLKVADALPTWAASRAEAPFVHVADASAAAATAVSESRYGVLFHADHRVTGVADLAIGEYVARNARTLTQGSLPDHLAALDRLATLPTARLERLLAEHLDTVGYRLDAWKSGVLELGLQLLRSSRADEGGGNGIAIAHVPRARARSAGTHLGMYGWVEPLRPEGKTLRPAVLPPDVEAVVNAHDTQPLLTDPTNLGLIHAPSLGHAATSAVLRNAYVAHSGELNVNLSSKRVRGALGILEGMRGGQSIGALLGYQLERHVHDHGPLTVRALVYPLRREFPLVADAFADTATTDGDAKEAIAAMNVVDGRKLLLHVEKTDVEAYPFGISGLPRRSAPEEQAITDAVRYIRDLNDAVADLVVSEGVHQAVVGNYDRSAGTLDAFAKGSTPPEPDVIRTPRSGVTLTLRTAIHLPATTANPFSFPMTPLASAEPGLNHWLADRMPDPGDVAVTVSYVHRVSGATERTVSQQQLEWQPADLLYRMGAEVGFGDLDERILAYLHAAEPVDITGQITIQHTRRVPGAVTFFELEALLRSLRRIVLGARPLRASDLVRQSDARESDQSTASLPVSRLEGARNALRDVHLPALAILQTEVDDPLRTVDDAIARFEAVAARLAPFRIRDAGSGFAYEWRAATYSAITGEVTGEDAGKPARSLAAHIADWDTRLASFATVMAEFSALPGGADVEERLQLLRTADSLVSTTVSTDPSWTSLESAVALRHTALVTKRAALAQIATVPRPTLAALVADAMTAADTSAFDHDPLSLVVHLDEIARFRAELSATVARLIEQVQTRVGAADAALARHLAAAPADQAAAVVEGLRAVFGEDFVSVPRVTLTATATAELANALAHSTGGGLTKHLTDPPPAGSGRDFPEDDWLHGVARVRPKMHHLENVVLLSGALPGGTPPTLTPLQVPFVAGDPWLGLELPAGTEAPGERLLYTSALGATFDPSAPVGGLLVDEWTEVIPATTQTTGVAFHHDRPNAEPPQAWLLALPAAIDEGWRWDDLVGAVTDALDSAKLRAVEPVHLDATAYDALLPATQSSWTFPEISISNNLLRNVGVYTRLAAEGDR